MEDFFAMKTNILLLLLLLASATAGAQVSEAWVADRGDGTYRNPVLHADYSDPDVCRAGDDYYMTASSFNHTPGLPILHSKDLVNWTIVGHALPVQVSTERFATPQHGNGVWAPCIRYHGGIFHIYWGDPDAGVYRVGAADPRGVWSEPQLVMAGKGYIDATPLWDDDGRAYLAYAWAGSRAGINSIINVVELDAEGARAISAPVMVYDGNFSPDHTIEGPKFYKRGDYYYIFAPAGGVATGWQLALRSKSVWGPYAVRTVMAQGDTDINGPHQGAWVETPGGESWFMNFQDLGIYGRVVHLNPMHWGADGWPVIGADVDGDGCGEPVRTWRKPYTDRSWPVATPADTDEFDLPRMGLQWQWPANYDRVFGFPTSLGFFRLNGHNLPESEPNLWNVPNMLLQKFMAEEFSATTGLRFTVKAEGERAGLIVMGHDYGAIQAVYRGGEFVIEQTVCLGAETGGAERTVEIVRLPARRETYTQRSLKGFLNIWFRVEVVSGGVCRFAYSVDGERYTFAPESFTAKAGRWVGAKVGLFSITPAPREKCWIDIDWFRVSNPN